MVDMTRASRNTCLRMKKCKLHFWYYFKYLLNIILSVESHKMHISYYVIFVKKNPLTSSRLMAK